MTAPLAPSVPNVAIWATRRPDGAFDRLVERQAQRGWLRGEIEAALRQAGFGSVRCYGNLTLRAPGPQARRLHFLAKKPLE